MNPATHPRSHTDPPPWTHPWKGDEGGVEEKKKREGKKEKEKEREREREREGENRENLFLMREGREKNKEIFFYAFLLR